MQTTQSRLTAGFLSLENKQAFNVVLVYEDYATGLRAKRMYDQVSRQLEPECEVNQSMWKFEVLNVPRLCAVAAEEAAEADMIIISLSGENALPAKIKDWLETWVGEKAGQSCALVALFDEIEEEESQIDAIRNHLRQVARRGGMSFFADPAGSPEWDSVQAPEQMRVPLEETTPAWETGFTYDPPSRHWGINE